MTSSLEMGLYFVREILLLRCMKVCLYLRQTFFFAKSAKSFWTYGYSYIYIKRGIGPHKVSLWLTPLHCKHILVHLIWSWSYENHPRSLTLGQGSSYEECNIWPWKHQMSVPADDLTVDGSSYWKHIHDPGIICSSLKMQQKENQTATIALCSLFIVENVTEKSAKKRTWGRLWLHFQVHFNNPGVKFGSWKIQQD